MRRDVRPSTSELGGLVGLFLDLPRMEPGQSPLLPHIYISRPSLWTRLDLSTSAGVTVVVAPAGAGKTLGVAGWVRDDPARQDTVWVNAHRSADLDVLRTHLHQVAQPGGASPAVEPAPL